MAANYRGVVGTCYAECGCAAGAQIIAMLEGSEFKRPIWAFDSFEGIPLPSNKDDQMPGIAMLKPWEIASLPEPGKQVLKSSGATIVSLEDFWDHIYRALGHEEWFPLTTVKGWFEETMLNLNPEINKISLLRLDGDLYNSTWVCLQHLFPKVIQGGCVIVDDWSLPGCQAACVEYFESIGYKPEYNFLDGTAYFFKA